MSCGIRLQNLSVRYDRQMAIHRLSGTFAPGTVTAVIGANGAGKTTLLKAIADMLEPAEGHIERFGPDAHRIAYLPQKATIDRDFPITVMDTVILGLWHRIGLFRAVTGRLHDEVCEALEAVGLAGFENRAIAALSAGQFQRVLFARVLLQDCPVILLDEPFSAIDAATTAILFDMVHRWHAEQRTVIAVLHDLAQVREHFPQTLLLHNEVLDWGSTGSVMASMPPSSATVPIQNAPFQSGHREGSA